VSRGYGEGSVYRKGTGWEASAYIDGRRRSVRGRTMHEARDRLRALQARAAAGEPVTDERLTVAEYLEYWLSVTESTVRPSTHQRYQQYVRVHAVPIIGHLRLVELKPMHLQQLYAKRLQAGSSPATVHHLHACLHRALAMAERWEQVNRNVARLVTPPRVPRPQIEPLTLDEVRRLLSAARGSRFEAALVVAVVTGVRLGELLALRWDDIDLGDAPTVRVRGTLQRADGRLQILEPKTAQSVRVIAIGRLGAGALRAHHVRQAEERLRIGSCWTDRDLVFPNVWGEYMNPEWFRRKEFYPLLDAAGLRRIRFHDLRHTFATLQLANNQPLKIVSEMMGHTRIAITQDLYTHVSAAMQRSAADALDLALRTERPKPRPSRSAEVPGQQVLPLDP
jgi:integrase